MAQSKQSKHRCICNFRFCQENGGNATVRVPDKEREEWLSKLGREGESCPNKDARVSLAHFDAESIEASTDGSGPGGVDVIVRVARGAQPTQTNAQMEDAARGAVPRWLRAQAESKRHREALVKAECTRQQLETKKANLESTVEELKAKKRRSAEAAEEKKTKEDGKQSTKKAMDFHILEGVTGEQARSLCGLSSTLSLQNFYDALNSEGVADNLVFYVGRDATGVKVDDRKIVPRKKKLGGINGCFFALFMLRTATPLRVASALFGVSETTASRAFITWMNFLSGSLRPLVRLPEVHETIETAPASFREKQLGSVAVVLGAAETPLDKGWETDAVRAILSNYEGKVTGKVLIGLTPGGAICFISEAYGGSMSNADLVKESGFMDKLAEKGFGNHGMHVMADSSFNSIAPPLAAKGLHYVAPPSKRKYGEPFTPDDATITRDVENLRVHVDRAIGALKQWKILDGKFDPQHLENLTQCYQICGGLVNMLCPPFASAT